MENTLCVLSFRMVFFYLVTTGWIFYISLCDNSINQSINQGLHEDQDGSSSIPNCRALAYHQIHGHASLSNLQAEWGCIIIGCLRKTQLGFGFSLLILPKTENRWVFRYFVFCKAELPPKARERTDIGLAQFVVSKNLCLLVYTPRDHPDIRRTRPVL